MFFIRMFALLSERFFTKEKFVFKRNVFQGFALSELLVSLEVKFECKIKSLDKTNPCKASEEKN